MQFMCARRAWLPVGLAAIALLLSACDTPAPPAESTDASGETSAVTIPEAEISYQVTVQNSDGSPASDVIVRLLKNGEEIAFKLIGPTGSTTFKAASGEYTVSAETPSGKILHVIPENTLLTPESTEITLTIYESVTKTQPLNAPSQKGDYTHFDAACVGEGQTFVSFVSGDHTYVIFTPTRSGVYEIGFISEHPVEISYHGAPINVFDSPLLDTVDGKITLPVTDGSVGDTPDTTAQYVFRLNSSEANGCLFTVTRTGDVPKSPYDEPWTVLTAPAEALKPYEGDTSGRLTDLDVTDPTLCS